jgi:hypothetical protein
MDMKLGDANTALGSSASGSSRAIAKLCGSTEKDWVMQCHLMDKETRRKAAALSSECSAENKSVPFSVSLNLVEGYAGEVDSYMKLITRR